MTRESFDKILNSTVGAYDAILSGRMHPVRLSRQTDVRGLKIGGGAEVLVQSMTGTKTSDISATVKQIIELYDAGSRLVRIALRDHADADALPKVKAELTKNGRDPRLALCMHYNGHLLLEQHPECVEIADKFRINPGNVGFLDKWDDQCARIVNAVKKVPGKSIRIGVNWGSLDQSIQAHIMDKLRGRAAEDIEVIALVVSALTSAKFVENLDFNPNQIVVSCKVSDPRLTHIVNKCLAAVSDYPLHLGVTEAGEGDEAVVATACGLAPLLSMGIGDTIRASLTDHTNSPRSREVEVCKLVLQSLGIRRFAPSINSCPGCGRAKGDFFKWLTVDIKDFVSSNLPDWLKNREGVADLRVAVMGCVVNGPGESKKAHVGISLPGFGEGDENCAVVYIDGKQDRILKGDQHSIAKQCKEIITGYVETRYMKTSSQALTSAVN
jgi:(E)-4-hydroxy-3-methylbut-2-enyl-diphosphate synthase